LARELCWEDDGIKKLGFFKAEDDENYSDFRTSKILCFLGILSAVGLNRLTQDGKTAKLIATL